LIGKGYRKIGIVAYKSSLIHMQERISGYCGAMRDANMEKEIVIREVRFDHVDHDIRDIIDELIVKQKKAEVLYFATNSLSIAGLYCLSRLGIKIPDELAVMGFYGNEAFDFFYSPVSYVEQPIEEMGKEAVRILVDLLKGSCKTVHALMKHRLIIRESTEYREILNA
jgi:LacI family transcriptional regulator